MGGLWHNSDPITSDSLVQGNPVKMKLNNAFQTAKTAITIGINGNSINEINSGGTAHFYNLDAGSLDVGDAFVYEVDLKFINSSGTPQTATYKCNFEVSGTPYDFGTETIPVTNTGDNSLGVMTVTFKILHNSIYGDLIVARYEIRLWNPANPDLETYFHSSFIEEPFIFLTDSAQVSSHISSSSASLTSSIMASSCNGFF